VEVGIGAVVEDSVEEEEVLVTVEDEEVMVVEEEEEVLVTGEEEGDSEDEVVVEVSDHQRDVAVSEAVEGAEVHRGVAEEAEEALVEERRSWWSHTDMKECSSAEGRRMLWLQRTWW